MARRYRREKCGAYDYKITITFQVFKGGFKGDATRSLRADLARVHAKKKRRSHTKLEGRVLKVIKSFQ